MIYCQLVLVCDYHKCQVCKLLHLPGCASVISHCRTVVFDPTSNQNLAQEHPRAGEAVQLSLDADQQRNTFGHSNLRICFHLCVPG